MTKLNIALLLASLSSGGLVAPASANALKTETTIAAPTTQMRSPSEGDVATSVRETGATGTRSGTTAIEWGELSGSFDGPDGKEAAASLRVLPRAVATSAPRGAGTPLMLGIGY